MSAEPLIDPDCKAGKCATCVGGPCEHDCHLPPTEAAERAAFRERLAEREAVGARYSMAELNRPIRQAVFDQTKVLDPAPVERLASTVAEVWALRLLAEQSRRDALHAAALVYQGRAHDVGTETILLAADDFAAWLRDEPLPDPVRPRSDVVHPASTILGYTLAEYRDLDGEDVERMVGMLQDALDDPSSSDIDRAWFRTALAILRRQR